MIYHLLTTKERNLYNMIEISNKAQLDTLLAENENVFVDFYAEWCGPCKMMLPLLDGLSKEEDNKHIVLCKVNVDTNAELTLEYGITSIPHMFLMKHGNKVHDFKGAQSKPKIVDMFKTYFSL